MSTVIRTLKNQTEQESEKSINFPVKVLFLFLSN